MQQHILVAAMLAVAFGAAPLAAQHSAHPAPDTLSAGDAGAEMHAAHHAPADTAAPSADPRDDSTPADDGHAMWMRPLGGGWSVAGMAQAFPLLTSGLADDGSPLEGTEAYLTQPAAMLNVESPGSRFVFRTTLNFEGITQPDGEATFGGWGEEFIDRRHPHTLLHEAMVSFNAWDVAGGAASLSLGKGFAPFGTEDPMGRPVVKFPTNHHLSQILERWTANAVYVRGGWSVEAGLFGGSEPEGPYDLSNVESFGDSWSARLTRRFGPWTGASAPWEVAVSYGSVLESHGDVEERLNLVNGTVRHLADHPFGRLYAMAEASRSTPAHADDHAHEEPGAVEEEETEGDLWALLAEARLETGPGGRHQPYARVEWSTRPEYAREAADGDDFFRYDHEAEPIGATRWLIGSLGYGYEATRGTVSVRPFAEVQLNRVAAERGGIEPEALYGGDRFWSVSLGARIFLSGDPMRMGTYGVLDDMTRMHRDAGHGAGHGSHDEMRSTGASGHDAHDASHH